MSYAFPNCLHPEQELLVHYELDPLLQMACQTKYEQDGLPKIEMNVNERRNGGFDIRLNISILYD